MASVAHCGIASSVIEKMHTPAQVADALEIDEQTVRRFLRDGVLAGHRIGRRWRISESQLADYMRRTLADRPPDDPPPPHD